MFNQEAINEIGKYITGSVIKLIYIDTHLTAAQFEENLNRSIRNTLLETPFKELVDHDYWKQKIIADETKEGFDEFYRNSIYENIDQVVELIDRAAEKYNENLSKYCRVPYRFFNKASRNNLAWSKAEYLDISRVNLVANEDGTGASTRYPLNREDVRLFELTAVVDEQSTPHRHVMFSTDITRLWKIASMIPCVDPDKRFSNELETKIYVDKAGHRIVKDIAVRKMYSDAHDNHFNFMTSSATRPMWLVETHSYSGKVEREAIFYREKDVAEFVEKLWTEHKLPGKSTVKEITEP